MHVEENSKKEKNEDKKTESISEEKVETIATETNSEIIPPSISSQSAVSEEIKTEIESDSVTELILIITETIDSLEADIKVSTVRALISLLFGSFVLYSVCVFSRSLFHLSYFLIPYLSLITSSHLNPLCILHSSRPLPFSHSLPPFPLHHFNHI